MLDNEMARRLWTVFEPYHATIYFAPEARAAYAEAGLKGFWMGYFASRAAALGPVPAPVVTASFYSFAPRMVERAIPDAWHFSSPPQVLAARTSPPAARVKLALLRVDTLRIVKKGTVSVQGATIWVPEAQRTIPNPRAGTFNYRAAVDLASQTTPLRLWSSSVNHLSIDSVTRS